VRHTPQRRCLGCGARRDKGELARFVAAPAGGGHALARDDGSRLPGRGLYVCRQRECFDRAVARRGFHRGARIAGELTIDPDLGPAVEMKDRLGT
jgi:predicted RNA-binding protein YlxR (DUF448 family)